MKQIKKLAVKEKQTHRHFLFLSLLQGQDEIGSGDGPEMGGMREWNGANGRMADEVYGLCTVKSTNYLLLNIYNKLICLK